VAYRPHGAGGEQTVQGLLADAATELDAAMLLVQQAALRSPMSLAQASMAKLARHAKRRSGRRARATQIVGAESFREGHILEQLTQDVRALELFAGRTGRRCAKRSRRSVAEGREAALAATRAEPPYGQAAARDGLLCRFALPS
jgi:alkylation response protein AidB-like acyl-CoA dehydrogenase